MTIPAEGQVLYMQIDTAAVSHDQEEAIQPSSDMFPKCVKSRSKRWIILPPRISRTLGVAEILERWPGTGRVAEADGVDGFRELSGRHRGRVIVQAHTIGERLPVGRWHSGTSSR